MPRIDDLLAMQGAPTVRPRVNVVERDFYELHIELVEQLLQSEGGSTGQPSLFLHGSDLVVAGRGRLQKLDQPMLTKELAARLEFIKRVQEGNNNWVDRPASPPKDVIAAMYSGREQLDLPEVDRVAHTPFFGPDATLQRKPGYHHAAKVLYVPEPGLVVPDVPVNPTPSEISAALKLITEELLDDFPFASPGDRAGALAAGLTPYVHPLINGPTPIMAFDAPKSRSGKGLLMEALLAPACGRSWTTTPAPARAEEWHKQIVAALRPGPLVAAFDNVNSKINSGALASAVTAWPAITSRLLGLSENVRMPLPAVWAVTGNNLQASTEIAERSVRIRIDSGEENPGRRTGFRHPNLRRWFTERRGEIIAAWLTLAQAWIAAGRPVVDVPAFGSFEEWTEVVGSILAFHDIDGLLSNRAEASDTMDDEQGGWREFMAYWARVGPLEQTASNLAAMAANDDGPGCPVDLSSPIEKARATAIGVALRPLRDQRFGDYILKRWPRENKTRGWYLELVAKQEPAE
jgi:putative DNA primase/helicase